MKQLIEDLYLLNRSLICDDFDEALAYIDDLVGLDIHEYPSGTECWTWVVPQKWTVREAFIEEDGKRIVDFADHPLHLWTGSLPVDRVVSREELLDHLAWDEERPGAIPYKFHLYELTWGFSVTCDQFQQMQADEYRVLIDSEYSDGHLKVGEATVEGSSDEVVVLMAHLDHPGQANDDLAGVAVLAELVHELRKRDTYYTYKFLILPETIGSIAYFSHNEDLIPRCRCGIFLEMLGNDNTIALQYSLQGDDLIDRAARRALVDRYGEGNFAEGAFRKVVGNDEMVLNGPGVGVPTISISRWPYPQYHSSYDTPDIISEYRLVDARELILEVLDILDRDYVPRREFRGPVFLSRFGLWVDYRENFELNRAIETIMLNLEGDQSVLDITDRTKVSYREVYGFIERLRELGLATRLAKEPPSE